MRAHTQQLVAFKQGAAGWFGREFGDAALQQVSIDSAHVLSPKGEGGVTQLRVELSMPLKLRLQMDKVLGDGRLSLAPGAWPCETLAAWKGEFPRCTTRAVDVHPGLSYSALKGVLDKAGHTMESISSERDPDTGLRRGLVATLVFAAGLRPPDVHALPAAAARPVSEGASAARPPTHLGDGVQEVGAGEEDGDGDHHRVARGQVGGGRQRHCAPRLPVARGGGVGVAHRAERGALGGGERARDAVGAVGGAPGVGVGAGRGRGHRPACAGTEAGSVIDGPSAKLESPAASGSLAWSS